MSYSLTLSLDERKAIDWIGNRYAHGQDLYEALMCSDTQMSPDDADWTSPVDIIFTIPEYIAWQINDIGAESNYLWDCFAPAFAGKLTQFCFRIV